MKPGPAAFLREIPLGKYASGGWVCTVGFPLAFGGVGKRGFCLFLGNVSIERDEEKSTLVSVAKWLGLFCLWRGHRQ